LPSPADLLSYIRALTSSLLLVSCLFPARPPRCPAAWSRLVTGRSRRGCPSADTPVTPSHVATARVTVVTASARRPGPLPLAMSLTDRSPARAEGDRSVGHCSPGPLEPLAAASLRCGRDLAATMGSRRRSKMSQGPKGPLFLPLGSSCHAASGARIVPWRQPGDRAIKPSDRLHRASSAPIPTLLGG
jgi:hypothetical protein